MNTLLAKETVERKDGNSLIPSFPNEIIQRIFHHLSLDRQNATLARCMRISLDYNRIAAPLLYRLIHLHNEGHVLAGIVSSDPTTSRKTRNKAELLQLVEVVEFSGHDVHDCPYDTISWEVLDKPVPVLRGRHTDLDCPWLKHFSPKKLVIRIGHPFDKISISVNIKPSVNDLVIIMEPGGMPFYGGDLADRTAFEGHRPDRAVLIFRTTNRTAAFETEDSRQDPRLDPSEVLTHFIQALASLTMSVAFPEDVTVVNIKPLWSLVEPDSSEDANDACLERYNEYLPTLKRRAQAEEPWEYDLVGQARRKPKTSAELARVKVRFIDMDTYLADHDWKGELSRQELAPWLRSTHVMDIKANMKEKEEKEGREETKQ